MDLDLMDEERAELIELLRDTIDRDRFPLSPRIKLLRSILEKLGIHWQCRATTRSQNPSSSQHSRRRTGDGGDPERSLPWR
jgi:hypothetical protein